MAENEIVLRLTLSNPTFDAFMGCNIEKVELVEGSKQVDVDAVACQICRACNTVKEYEARLSSEGASWQKGFNTGFNAGFKEGEETPDDTP